MTLEDYIPFIKEYNVGSEGTSGWIWWQTKEGHWESKGYACDTIEESLEKLMAYVEENDL